MADIPFDHTSSIARRVLACGNSGTSLSRWTKGGVILIGDCSCEVSNARQGASQSIQDAEALGAFFNGASSHCNLPSPTSKSCSRCHVFAVRHEHEAALLQKYTRQQDKPEADVETLEATL
ncbi:BQ2448_1595 [Microbotryum intermedium]|uniref:BQ2448_1595 protein n=1 Tax=Microbotryum intermedium TaxID=269621 RepID=A0A238FDK2_9BASI|nr:BQ2448_1595 [Microbotryum intermedium]